MTNTEKLEQAIHLLSEVSRDWDEEKVVSYPKTLMSFDELVSELRLIKLKD